MSLPGLFGGLSTKLSTNKRGKASAARILSHTRITSWHLETFCETRVAVFLEEATKKEMDSTEDKDNAIRERAK